MTDFKFPQMCKYYISLDCKLSIEHDFFLYQINFFEHTKCKKFSHIITAAIFKGLRDINFQTENVVCFGLHESSLHSLRGEDQLDTIYGRKI